MKSDKTRLCRKLPLNCPFCDEEAYAEDKVKRIVKPDRIYTLRKCIMGHEFYSVEIIPEDQSAIVDEIRGKIVEDE